ncbi:MAG: aminotransferase class III-fold pyridoxal phosphate-dependent enzyme, partial [Myxococcota bacterium]|nr:aminotransferase class III-fold pyridoxal phosphate-dependent enzyme [Myxococcota bacterium]
ARGYAPVGGQFVAPTLHRLPDGVRHVPGYTDEELFGPDVVVIAFDDDEEAIAWIQRSPWGLAHAIFTRSRPRYERFYHALRVGILNWNRSTNQASPRLPFGGVGRSGNFRPAGSHAPRNLAIPVAVQENLPGVFAAHPLLAAQLPPPDWDALERLHDEEERAECRRTLLEAPRPLGFRLPRGGVLPRSEELLRRLYGADRMPRDKKPPVFDALRSVGPWLVSVDDEPLSVLDAMSQTATLPAGFAPDPVVEAYFDGRFGRSLLRAPDTTAVAGPEAEAFAKRLRELVPGLPHVSFVNSGAEATEKALALCRLAFAHETRRRRVLAFEGSFHGRTLLSLMASHNPAKRTPFEIAGHEVDYVPFPVWSRPHEPEPAEPEGWREGLGRGDIERTLRAAAAGPDALLAAEARVLLAVHERLGRGEHFAVIVEPMQSEGGDRYATARFFRALRWLTRRAGVPLVMDEVQTGFGLGGPFAWHSAFGLVDAQGAPDGPDAVTFAKRAQLGVVMSRFEDPEPTAVQTASLVRGLLHAELVASRRDRTAQIERRVRAHLETLSRRFESLVGDPRGRGHAFAFDLPSPAHLDAFLGQRFWRGAVVFGAGSRTARYRLSLAFGDAEIDALFESIARALAWLEAYPGRTPPAWEDVPAPRVADRPSATASATVAPEPRPAMQNDIALRRAERAERDVLVAAAMALEARVFEPARREPEGRLRACFDDPDGLVVVAERRAAGEPLRPVGFAFGLPLERCGEIEGVRRDSRWGAHDTLYSVSVVVEPDLQGSGLGRALKRAQLEHAASMRDGRGDARYRFVAGRVRVGHAEAMWRIDRALGAYELFRLRGQYGEAEAEAIYYRIALPPYAPAASSESPSTDTSTTELDVAGAIAAPLARAPASLEEACARGALFGPAVSKITISNYVTPALVRAVEYLGALSPRLPHLYLTSSRDEAFDKSLRALRWHRKSARTALGLQGGYVGHTTAAARSLSDPEVHRAGPAYFDAWSRVPHPADVGVEPWLVALDDAVRAAGGADEVIGLWLEPLQERTGKRLEAEHLEALETWRRRTRIPVVLVETASAYGRAGHWPFASSVGAFVPDALVWWGGGQVGFVHVADRFFVSAPLTLVSTWDGDELSAVRVVHQLRATRNRDVATLGQALDEALEPLRTAGLRVRGAGVYRVVEAGSRTPSLVDQLAARGIRTRAWPHGAFPVVLPLDATPDDVARLSRAVRGALP